ncbi:MAG: D-alanyl-D-alanine carboxypeptidase/D-alanyl-D-alanine-endopeptidase [Sandaracinaceae bacterium]
MRASHASALFFALLVLVSVPGGARAQSIEQTLSGLVSSSGLSDRVGIAVVDVHTGQALFSHRAEVPMNPASNQKLLTAYAALRRLGPQFTMRTAAYGHLEGGRIDGGIVIRGYGDPRLSYGDLNELAREVHLAGARRASHVIVDATYFDAQTLPNAFEQQPDETATFRAPISAVAVDRNSYVLRVRPGSEAGAPAIIDLLGAPYFQLTNRCTTSASGAPNVIADQRPGDAHMILRLSGTIPLGVRGASYPRRIEDPLPWVGYVFADALRAQGVEVGERVEIGSTPSDAALLGSHESEPVSELIHALGKHSDNFVAEMLFRVMGAERHRPGSSDDSIAALRETLATIGVGDGVEIVNGSGLFEGNRVAPRDLARLLREAYRDPTIGHELVSSLAIGGVDGTLENRLRDLPAPRIVRAKTGTLAAVIALSGYVLGPTPEQVYAFSFLANDVRGRQGQARALADDVARALAARLYPRGRSTAESERTATP